MIQNDVTFKDKRKPNIFSVEVPQTLGQIPPAKSSTDLRKRCSALMMTDLIIISYLLDRHEHKSVNSPFW